MFLHGLNLEISKCKVNIDNNTCNCEIGIDTFDVFQMGIFIEWYLYYFSTSMCFCKRVYLSITWIFVTSLQAKGIKRVLISLCDIIIQTICIIAFRVCNIKFWCITKMPLVPHCFSLASTSVMKNNLCVWFCISSFGKLV